MISGDFPAQFMVPILTIGVAGLRVETGSSLPLPREMKECPGVLLHNMRDSDATAGGLVLMKL